MRGICGEGFSHLWAGLRGAVTLQGGWARGPRAPSCVTFSMRSISLSSSPILWSFSSRLISAACIFLLASSMAFRKLLVSSCKRNALFSGQHSVTTSQGSNSSGLTKSSCLFRSMTREPRRVSENHEPKFHDSGSNQWIKDTLQGPSYLSAFFPPPWGKKKEPTNVIYPLTRCSKYHCICQQHKGN